VTGPPSGTVTPRTMRAAWTCRPFGYRRPATDGAW